MKLISMTDLILQKEIRTLNYTNIFEYAKFLKQPLELWMFVPCDEDRNVLEEPKISCASCNKCTCSESYHKEYKQAKERCLFEVFKYSVDYIQTSNKCHVVTCNKISIGIGFKNGLHQIIEDLTEYDLQLTKTAIKQLGL